MKQTDAIGDTTGTGRGVVVSFVSKQGGNGKQDDIERRDGKAASKTASGAGRETAQEAARGAGRPERRNDKATSTAGRGSGKGSGKQLWKLEDNGKLNIQPASKETGHMRKVIGIGVMAALVAGLGLLSIPRNRVCRR